MTPTPEQMAAAITRRLEQRTGRSLSEWKRIARRSGETEPKELRAWLKEVHGLGVNTCWVIADATLGTKGGTKLSPKQQLADQFAGVGAALRPTYDALVRAVEALGPDVQVLPRLTQTTFARKHTFAVAKAPTRKGIELGLRLPGARATKRRVATKAFSGNATHCVLLADPDDVDAQLESWLKAAYDARA